MVRTSDSSSSTAIDMNRDLEDQKNAQKKARHWELVFDQIHVTPEVLNYPYKGSGTDSDPYVVEYIPGDRRNPLSFTMLKKWSITMLLAFVSSHLPFYVIKVSVIIFRNLVCVTNGSEISYTQVPTY